MSHFILNIILPTDQVTKAKIAEMVDPYYDKQVEPYLIHTKQDVEKMYQKELQHCEEVLNEGHNYGLKVNPVSFRKHYEELKNMHIEEYCKFYLQGYIVDKDCNIFSTHNPNIRFEWGVIGGRFSGWLKTPATDPVKIEKDNLVILEARKQKKIIMRLLKEDGTWLEMQKPDKVSDADWEQHAVAHYFNNPSHVPDFMVDWWNAVKVRYINPNGGSNEIGDNSCPIEFAIEHKKIPQAIILPTGEWIDGWKYMDDTSLYEQWQKMVIEYYNKYPGHTVVQLDCHDC